jgi:hypothetical protein
MQDSLPVDVVLSLHAQEPQDPITYRRRQIVCDEAAHLHAKGQILGGFTQIHDAPLSCL